MSGYRVYLDGKEWCDMKDKDEAVDYADWLVSMPYYDPEAKGDGSCVVDLDSGDSLFEASRTDFGI